MAWLRRDLTAEVRAAPADVARHLERSGRGTGRVRLLGPIGPAGFDLHSAWRPALLRQHYPVSAIGTLTPTPAGTRVEATVAVGFAVQFMLAGAAAVAGLALWAGASGLWSPTTAGLILTVALGHVYSVLANLRDAERSLRQALHGLAAGTGPELS
jgi:hypothetical protein